MLIKFRYRFWFHQFIYGNIVFVFVPYLITILHNIRMNANLRKQKLCFLAHHEHLVHEFADVALVILNMPFFKFGNNFLREVLKTNFDYLVQCLELFWLLVYLTRITGIRIILIISINLLAGKVHRSSCNRITLRIFIIFSGRLCYLLLSSFVVFTFYLGAYLGGFGGTINLRALIVRCGATNLQFLSFLIL